MKHRSALIMTASKVGFYPGMDAWDRISRSLSSDLRAVSILGVLPTFGVLPESAIRENPTYIRLGEISDVDESVLEGAAKIRTWLDTEAPSFEKIVYVRGDRLGSRAWDMAVPGSRVASKIIVERPVRDRQGLGGLFFHERIRRRLVGG